MVPAAQMGDRMKAARWLGLVCLLLFALPVWAGTYVVTIAGLGGEPDYEQRFEGNAKDIERVFKSAGSQVHAITLYGDDGTKDKLTSALQQVASEAKADDDFVLIMIGHGSFDGFEYKFNLVGPDISADDIAALCDKIPSKRQLIVNTTSASGGSLIPLERPGRAVIMATKSGTERNETILRVILPKLCKTPPRIRTKTSRSARWRLLFTQRRKRRIFTIPSSNSRPSTRSSRTQARL